MMGFRTRSAVLLALTLVTPIYAQSLDKAKLEQFFDRLAEKNKAMGSAAVAKNGELLYSRVIGYSQINGAEKKEATAASRYRIGSITKMFTAVIIMQLVEEKKLQLSDRLTQFHPSVPNAETITIEQLLGHRSGIHDLTDDPDFRSWKSNAKTQDEMVAVVAKGGSEFAPGEKAEYSNSNYVLLGYILEKVTGKSYAENLKERITSKISLKDTSLGTGTDPDKDECVSYRYGGEWKQEDATHLSIPGGAGAIISTPEDLTKFIHALFSAKLVSQASLDRMIPSDGKYGLGIVQLELDDKKLYGHGGGIDGFRSLLVYQPEEKLAVAYCTNGVNLSPNEIAMTMVQICWNKPVELPAFETVAVSPEVLDTYVGVYSSSEAPVKFTITRENQTLLAQPDGKPAIALEAAAQNTFKFDPAGIVMVFDSTKKQMTLKRGGRETVFTKES